MQSGAVSVKMRAFAVFAMPRVVAPLLACRRRAVVVDAGAGFELAGRGRARREREQQGCAHRDRRRRGVNERV